MQESDIAPKHWRFYVIVASFITLGIVVLFRAADMQVIDSDFYLKHADARQQRTKNIAVPRGVIYDRKKQPLAVSTPIYSAWINPRTFVTDQDSFVKMAALLSESPADIQEKIVDRQQKAFVYLKRQVSPDTKQQLDALGIDGLHFDKEFRRFYPEREVASQVVGLTNIDDQGLEGIELMFDEWLSGENGSKRVIQDNRRNVISGIEFKNQPKPGQDISLTIDRQLQYLAYKELAVTMQKHNASSAAAVVIEPKTGHILAMANLPSFNPNDRSHVVPGSTRNRAVTDTFEPGSTLKPFAIAAAMAGSGIAPNDSVDTHPGWYNIGRHQVKDSRNYGMLTVSEVLQKSSNVGTSRMILNLPDEALPDLLQKCGFGIATGVQFPGESYGTMPIKNRWRTIEKATLSFGYGMSSTVLQLARAYSIFANEGKLPYLTLLKGSEPEEPQIVLDRKIATQVKEMMEGVISIEGTARQASIDGYRVAGKTGTAKKVGANGYEDKKYVSIFAGMVPVSDPRFVMVVLVDEPKNGDYYGGAVAGPVFKNVMVGALRMYNVPPDDIDAIVDARQELVKEAI